MIIKDTFEVPVGKEQAAAFLLDVERMSACVPGMQDVRFVDDQYEATLRMQMGPIRSEFVGHARLDDTGAPDRLSATAEGRDRATGSQVQVIFHAEITEHPGPRTVVDCTADVTIRGRLGQFGTGLITSTAKSVLREFSDCAGQTLAAETSQASGASAVQLPAPRTSVARIIRRSLGLYFADLWSRLRSRLRRGNASGGSQ